VTRALRERRICQCQLLRMPHELRASPNVRRKGMPIPLGSRRRHTFGRKRSTTANYSTYVGLSKRPTIPRTQPYIVLSPLQDPAAEVCTVSGLLLCGRNEACTLSHAFARFRTLSHAFAPTITRPSEQKPSQSKAGHAVLSCGACVAIHGQQSMNATERTYE